MRISLSTILLCLLVAFVAASCQKQQSSEQNSPTASPDLVGTWRSSVEFNDGILATFKGLEFMMVMNQGGTMTESSNYDGVMPTPPAYGVWRKTGDLKFESHYEFFITKSPDSLAVLLTVGFPPAGRGILHETITLSPDGNSFTSTLRCDMFDIEGKPMDGGGVGTGSGVMMKL